jgi:hypothetical protein
MALRAIGISQLKYRYFATSLSGFCNIAYRDFATSDSGFCNIGPTAGTRQALDIATLSIGISQPEKALKGIEEKASNCDAQRALRADGITGGFFFASSAVSKETPRCRSQSRAGKYICRKGKASSRLVWGRPVRKGNSWNMDDREPSRLQCPGPA